jgi:CDP-diglyceride synthetase
MVGFILVALGLLAVWNALSRTRAEGLALAAVVTAWIGVGLTLPTDRPRRPSARRA